VGGQKSVQQRALIYTEVMILGDKCLESQMRKVLRK